MKHRVIYQLQIMTTYDISNNPTIPFEIEDESFQYPKKLYCRKYATGVIEIFRHDRKTDQYIVIDSTYPLYNKMLKKAKGTRIPACKLPSLINSTEYTELEGTKFEHTGKPGLFHTLKKYETKLNNEKAKLSEIDRKSESIRKYQFIAKESGFYNSLCGRDGYIASTFGAEIVSGTCLEFWEICDKFLKSDFEYKNKHKPQFRSFHVAEAPGDFVVSLNHFISRWELDWDWAAETCTGDYDQKIHDDYGLVLKNKNKWIYGADEDGDICSVANIRSFIHQLPKLLGAPVDLYTANGKIERSDSELNHLRLLYGQILCCLGVLRQGGNAVIKTFSIFEPPTISLLYLMRLLFTRLYLFKPKISSNTSSEIYIVAVGYNKITMKKYNDLLGWYSAVSDNVLYKYSIFREEDIDPVFLNQIGNICENRVKVQIAYLRRNLALYEEYHNHEIDTVLREMKPIRKKYAIRWLKTYEMIELKPEDRILI